MANENDYKYDPEAGEDTKKLRLPFALCKARGIEIKDWWTPRNAWDALKSNGAISDVSAEYEEYYRKLKKERQKEYDKNHPMRVQKRRDRAQTKKNQLKDPDHNPERNYQHQDGVIAGAVKGKPMTFEQADNGNCNPYFRKRDKSTGVEYIGYKTNCQTCVATYIARKRGYNVKALPNLNNKSIHDLSYNTSLAFVDKNGNHPKLKSIGSIAEAAFNMVRGQTYALQFDYRNTSSGHIVVMEKFVFGEITIYDPQSNDIIKESDFKSYGKNKRNFRIMDLTNVQIDEKFCDKIMRRR